MYAHWTNIVHVVVSLNRYPGHRQTEVMLVVSFDCEADQLPLGIHNNLEGHSLIKQLGLGTTKQQR